MADKQVKVKIDVETNTEGSIAELKALKKQLKETAAGSDEFKKIFNQIDDLEDKIKGAKKASSDWIDTLESAGGPIGALGAGLNKLKVATQSFGAALKATGIGLIVGLIGGLTAAFAASDDQMKKFQPLLIGLEKIFNGILAAVQPLIDGFIELATEALPYVSKAFGVVYSATTAVFQSLGKIGSSIVKLFKGDFKGAWADAKESVTGFVDNYEAGMERYVAGTKKMTKTEKENADKYRENLLKKLEAQDKYDEALLAKMKAEAMQTAFNDEQKLAVEEAFSKKLYELKTKEIDEKIKAQKKGSAEEKLLQAEKVQLDADRLTQLKGFSEQEKKIYDDNTKAIVDFEVQLAKRLQELDDEKRDKKIKALNDDLLLLQAQQKTLTEGSQAFLDNSIAIENEAYQIKLLNAKDNAKQIQAIETEHAQNIKDIKLAAFVAEKQIQLDRLNVIAGIGQSLAILAGKNKTLAIAAIAIEKAAAIGSIIVNTQIANAKAVSASPLTLGQPWVTINTIAGALGVAAAIASGIKAVQEINAVQVPGGGATSGASAGGYGAAPTAPTISSAAAPQIQTQGGNNPATQIAQTMNRAQAPLKAYVVSGDVSSQIALDRRTTRAATFAGG
jgi:hypothetical protein